MVTLCCSMSMVPRFLSRMREGCIDALLRFWVAGILLWIHVSELGGSEMGFVRNSPFIRLWHPVGRNSSLCSPDAGYFAPLHLYASEVNTL